MESQLLTNRGLTITMITVVAFLYVRGEFTGFEEFISENQRIA